MLVRDSRLCGQPYSIKDAHTPTHTPGGHIILYTDIFWVCFQPLFSRLMPHHCMLPAPLAWLLPSFVTDACFLSALQSCLSFLDGTVLDSLRWPLLPELWLLLYSRYTQSSTKKHQLWFPYRSSLISVHLTQSAVFVSGGWSSRSVLLQSLDGHTGLVCSVYVCVFDVCWPQAKQYLPLLPLIFSCFIYSRSLSLSAHPLNRLAGSWGDWRRRPGVSTLSLWYGPTGRDSRYLPAPRRSSSLSLPPTHHPWPNSSSSSVTIFAFTFRKPASAQCCDTIYLFYWHCLKSCASSYTKIPGVKQIGI